jgi:hypothetical protein
MTDLYIMYKIECLDASITEFYIGSTKAFRQRKTEHKQATTNTNHSKYNSKKYDFIRNNGGWENWKMYPIEEYKCDNIIQSRIREQYWIELLKPKLNTCFAYGVNIQKNKEYQKNYHKDYQKEYYNLNKNLISQKKKERYAKLKALTICESQ